MTSSTKKERFFYVSEILFQQMLAVFVLLIFWELFRSNYSISSKHTWHVVMCVVGIALCMAEGVQIFRKESVVTFGHTREDKKTAHLVVMALGYICITIGISLKINDKISSNRSHFQTSHSILGLTTWIIGFVAATGGLVMYLSKNSLGINPRIFKILHIFLGVSAYVLGIATLCLGMEYLVAGTGRAWVALVVVLVTYAAYSLIGPFTSLFNYLLNK